jgi:protein-tyrosine phosphatase
MMEAGSRAYAAAMRTVAEAEALPAVYFCMAGKDRTGVFSAFLLGILGVGDLDIVADYVLTHDVVEQIHARGRAERPDRDEAWKDMPEDLLGAHAPSMEGLLAGVHAKYGTWLGYADAIGLEEDVVMRVRELMLEDDA